MKSDVVFGDEKLQKQFEELKNTGDKQLFKQLERAFENLESNAFCGIQIPKKLIPQEYIRKFGEITNLWKYNLPDAWRLIYTIKNNKIEILSVLLDWLNHKDYERKFKY